MNATLLIDTREPEDLRKLVAQAADAIHLDHVESFLPYGDYVFVFPDYTVGVERKEVSDLLNTMREGRLFPQIAGLISSYTIPFLLVEGILHESAANNNLIVNGRETQWQAKAIHSILWSIQEQRVRLALASSSQTTVKRLMGMYGFYSSPDHRDLTTERMTVFQNHMAPPLRMLMGIPGIGYEKAKTLLEAFQSLNTISGLTEKELAEAKGIGKKHARDVYMALHTPYVGSKKEVA